MAGGILTVPMVAGRLRSKATNMTLLDPKSQWRPTPSQATKQASKVGVLRTMCSEHEIIERMKERIIPGFETRKGDPEKKADPTLCVKQYGRSSAGKEGQYAPEQIRDYNTLQKAAKWCFEKILDADLEGGFDYKTFDLENFIPQGVMPKDTTVYAHLNNR